MTATLRGVENELRCDVVYEPPAAYRDSSNVGRSVPSPVGDREDEKTVIGKQQATDKQSRGSNHYFRSKWELGCLYE